MEPCSSTISYLPDVFQNTPQDLGRATTKDTPDFVISTTEQSSHFKDLSLLALKVILFPWGLYEGMRYTAQRLIMIPLCPAQSRIVQKMCQPLNPQVLNENRLRGGKEASRLGYILREVTLEKDGRRYDGLILAKPDTIHNGKWILQATGNAQPIEWVVNSIYVEHAAFNTLFINGPSIGRSQGHAIPKTLGEAQELGFQFMESTLKAKQIAIAGFSLGGAAIGEAILQHEFKKGIEYLVIRQATFDRVSNIAKALFSKLGNLAAYAIYWTGLEMDNIEASKKLQKLGIKEVIVQASNRKLLEEESLPSISDIGSDGVIPAQASLAYTLLQEGVIENKVFRCIPNLQHNDSERIFMVTLLEVQKHFQNPSMPF